MSSFKKENDFYVLSLRGEHKVFESIEEYNKFIKDNPKKSVSGLYVGVGQYYSYVSGDDDSEESCELSKGFYRWSGGGFGEKEKLIKMKLKNEHLIDLLNESMKWHDNIENFISKFDLYKEMQIIPRRNMLLYGPAGTGKSSSIRRLAQKLVDSQEAIVIYVDGIISEQMCQALNKLSNFKLIIFEEVATSLQNGDVSLSSLLQWLDGEYVLNNSTTLLTTNHPELLPQNLMRFGRIDYVEEIAGLPDSDRKKILEFYLKQNPTEEQINLTENFVIADLKELCIKVKIEGLAFIQAVEEIKNKNKLVKKQFQKAGTEVGLGKSRGFRND